MKLLVGLYRPQGGDIRYDGISITDVDLDGLRKPHWTGDQDTQLFSGTIQENLLFVNPTASDADCMSVLSDGGVPESSRSRRQRTRYAHRRRRSEGFRRGKAAAVDRACSPAPAQSAGIR